MQLQGGGRPRGPQTGRSKEPCPPGWAGPSPALGLLWSLWMSRPQGPGEGGPRLCSGLIAPSRSRGPGPGSILAAPRWAPGSAGSGARRGGGSRAPRAPSCLQINKGAGVDPPPGCSPVTQQVLPPACPPGSRAEPARTLQRPGCGGTSNGAGIFFLILIFCGADLPPGARLRRGELVSPRRPARSLPAARAGAAPWSVSRRRLPALATNSQRPLPCPGSQYPASRN